MQSTANAHLHKDKREFFDRPVKYTNGMNTSSIDAKKPMENYHNITPVRSDKASQQVALAKRIMNLAEEAEKRPKSINRVGMLRSDNFGQIPNLRSNLIEEQ